MNYKIYFDNWFSSLKLMSLLKIKGFPCIGTLNKARLKDCPLLTDGEMKKRERGTSDYRTDIHSGVICSERVRQQHGLLGFDVCRNNTTGYVQNAGTSRINPGLKFQGQPLFMSTTVVWVA